MAQAFDPSLEAVHRAKRVAQTEQLVAVEQRDLALKNPAAAQWLADKKEMERAQAERVHALVDQCTLQLCAEIGEEQTANELGKRVVALRAKHREQLLLETPRFGSERELKQWLESHLSEDFELYSEVPGQHIATGTRVQIDYLAYPRQHLIDQGFAATHFGIEAKHLEPFDRFSHKASRALWQAVSYSDAAFELNGLTVRPKFALLFSNMSFEDERGLLDHLGKPFENDWALWRGLLQLANHANVGTLDIRGHANAWKGWKMAFSGGTYFYRRHYQEKREYRLSDSNLVEKVRIGNF